MTKIENISIANLSDHELELTITVPSAFVTKEYENALKHVQRVASRPGFRPGKLPRNMVQSFYGSEIKKTLMKKLMDESLDAACEDKKLVRVSEPKLEALGDCQREKAFTYRAAFQVKPEIDIEKYEGLSFEMKKFVFGDKDIEDELSNLRESQATLVAAPDRREVGPDDAVICDSEVFMDGVRMEEHSFKDYTIPMFDKTVPENVREALIGKSIGDIVPVSYEIPNEHQDDSIKGKVCEMRLGIKDFKERKLPLLDDEFAKDLSDKFKSLDDLRESVRTRFTITARRRDEYFKQDAITRALVENNPFEVPSALIERMALTLINRELESLPKHVAEDAVKNRWAEMWQSVQKHAQFRVKAQLLFEAAIKKLDIKASDTEVDDYVKKVKDAKPEDATYTIQVEKFLAAVEKSSSITVIEVPLLG